jgi:hypothetical protein
MWWSALHISTHQGAWVEATVPHHSLHLLLNVAHLGIQFYVVVTKSHCQTGHIPWAHAAIQFSSHLSFCLYFYILYMHVILSEVIIFKYYFPCFLGYFAVLYQLQTFQRCLLPPSSGWCGGSRHLWNVSNFFQTTCPKNPEDSHLTLNNSYKTIR